MQTVLDEAKESYAEEVVVELRSNSPEDVDANIERILQWIEAWKGNNADDEAPATEPER